MLKAGFCEVDFTPESGLVPGGIVPYLSQGVRTSLMAHAAAMENDFGSAILISLDAIMFSVEFCDRLRNEISQKTSVPFDAIMVVAIHTHTGCQTDYPCWGAPANAECAEKIYDAAKKAALQAWETREACKFGTGLGYERRFHFCRDWYMDNGIIKMNPGRKNSDRLVKPYAPIDDSVNVIRFDAEDGTPRCFIVNYANHLDTCRDKKFSADFVGDLRLALRKEFGDVTVLFLNGCCGNINHLDYHSDWTDQLYSQSDTCIPEIIGKGLAETIIGLQPPIVYEEKEFNIQCYSRKHPTARRLATKEMKEWAAQYQKDHPDEIPGTATENPRYTLLADMYLQDESKLPKVVDLEIQVMQLGPIVLVGLPGEIYSPIGLKIKAASPYAHTVIVELANGYQGYISTDEIQKSGCYEGTYSNVAFCGLGTEDVLVKGAETMLKAMFEADHMIRFGGMKHILPQ